jgi:hypothetical protein
MPEIADLLPLANPETGIDPVMYSKEDLDLLRVMNRVTAKQKNDTKQTLENYAENNQAVIDELIARQNLPRKVA